MSQALLPMELWGCCLGPIAGLLTPSTHAEPLRHRLWASLPGWGEEAQDPGKAPDSRTEPQGPERREHSQPGSTEGRWKQGGFWEGKFTEPGPTHTETPAASGQGRDRQREGNTQGVRARTVHGKKAGTDQKGITRENSARQLSFIPCKACVCTHYMQRCVDRCLTTVKGGETPPLSHLLIAVV